MTFLTGFDVSANIFIFYWYKINEAVKN